MYIVLLRISLESLSYTVTYMTTKKNSEKNYFILENSGSQQDWFEYPTSYMVLHLNSL